MNRMFAFNPKEHAESFKTNGFVHISAGVSAQFQAKLAGQVQRFLEANRLKDFALGDKEQALYEFPDDADYLGELCEAVAGVTGLDRERLVLSERHIKAYESDAASQPPAHKDRFASEVAVGLSVNVPSESRLILYPRDEVGVNPFNSSAELRASLWGESLPEATLTGARRTQIKDGAGDVTMFRGNAIWHFRENPAGTTMLYLKLNTHNSDPLGEDPGSPAWRQQTESLLALSDEAVGRSIPMLGRRVDSVQRRYTRAWQELAVVVLWGQPALALDEQEFAALKAMDGRRDVRAVVEAMGSAPAQGLRKLRRLAARGIVDLRPAAG